jgi:preprotein translocase subunit SecA
LERVENALQCGNLYALENSELLRRVNNALHAEYLLFRDKDYIVRDNKVELVDDFTGRVADRRRWPDGLQAAIEAKEQCAAAKNGAVLNSITLQHFLRHYPKLCGMTATAQIAEEELRAFYHLHIVVVPPHKKCIRMDHADSIYRTKKEKHDALVREIVAVHKQGCPILVGTQNVQESIQLAGVFREQGVSCEVLNAKEDRFEANIIAEAGRPGALTISTNMAGRGTDIRLGGADEKDKKWVIALGGLYVIGTNRNESRRIDNQLRGRAGRQGDPGSSRFFVSLEDDLYKKYRLGELLPPHKVAIDTAVVRSELNRIQRIIEGQHLEIKKTICRYTNIVEQQREHLFLKRREIFHGTAILDLYRISCADHFDELLKKIGLEALVLLCRQLTLSYIDAAWSEYLAEIEALREGIHLRAYGKQDPLFEFNKCASELFEKTLLESEDKNLKTFAAIEVKNGSVCLPDSGPKAPSSTWTYLVNDNPFDDAVTGLLMGDTGFSLWAGLLWPLTMLHYLLKKNGKRKPETPQ